MQYEVGGEVVGKASANRLHVGHSLTAVFVHVHRYTYEVTVNMETNGGLLKRHAEISITFDHSFTNFTRLLRSDDKIRFKGTLTNEKDSYNIGNKDLVVRGHEIKCIECKTARGTVSSGTPYASKISELIKTVTNDCIVSAKYILNFILNPIVVFK